MKRLLLWLAGGIAGVGLTLVAQLYLAPGTVIALTHWQAARAVGLDDKIIMLGGYEAHYFEGGTSPILVMLHGMADDRNSFVASTDRLADSYHITLPDLNLVK